jgi:hypothetical protein
MTERSRPLKNVYYLLFQEEKAPKLARRQKKEGKQSPQPGQEEYGVGT